MGHPLLFLLILMFTSIMPQTSFSRHSIRKRTKVYVIMSLSSRKGRKKLQIKGIRVYVVLIVLAITLGVLLTAQYAYQKYNVEQPLFKMYSETKLVNDVKLEDDGEVVKVVLDVKKTDDLKQAYRELRGYTEEIIGQKQFQMELKDKRTKELSDAYYRSQYMIYEALVKGDFSRMATVIEENAGKIEAESRVFIDSDNIYVEFIKGENYLYEVVPRRNVNTEVSGMIGSD